MKTVAAVAAFVVAVASVAGPPTNMPSVAEAMDFLVGQIELHNTVQTALKTGPSSIRIVRARYAGGPSETVEFDFADIDEHYIVGAAALLNCARRGCVRIISAEGASTTENSVTLNSGSSDRATRIVSAAKLIHERLAKKTPF
jgi:hypothetical protein